jgi:hypothetical protein
MCWKTNSLRLLKVTATMMNRMITMPICREISTAVQQDSWGRIKASIRGDLQWLDALRFGLR